MTPGTALVVVDLQNDFCAPEVVRGRHGATPEDLAAVTTRAARAVDVARANGTEVVFVRFVGDMVHQGASWRARDAALGKAPKCRDGSWGAEFRGVTPAADEHVFTKLACFDAFLAEGFESHLRSRAVEHVVLAGVYADVCVDSTARTAFQKGFHVTVLTDCTTSLHLSGDDVFRFMRRVYGARTVPLDAWSAGPGRSGAWAASRAGSA
ncbi:cysteine hydrolase family protein [Saccharothrix obliqua]|uniref:cysteine hydrolase family protein n=1 Tax=Saccharothrix obliqua TaxID=2861747 RepID=UPI001C6000DD|nr:isochorismatase family cysteine hydrolase [Saccharothrix obliqua]MBW4717171.1 cysteine hydrolase [Saccharothrix obliqua]